MLCREVAAQRSIIMDAILGDCSRRGDVLRGTPPYTCGAGAVEQREDLFAKLLSQMNKNYGRLESPPHIETDALRLVRCGRPFGGFEPKSEMTILLLKLPKTNRGATILVVSEQYLKLTGVLPIGRTSN